MKSLSSNEIYPLITLLNVSDFHNSSVVSALNGEYSVEEMN